MTQDMFLDGTYHTFKLILSTNKQPLFLLVCSDRENRATLVSESWFSFS